MFLLEEDRNWNKWGKKGCKERQQKPFSWTHWLHPVLCSRNSCILFAFQYARQWHWKKLPISYYLRLRRSCSQNDVRSGMSGDCDLPKHHVKHKRTSQICPSSFLMSIRISDTKEIGHLLISKTSVLEEPSNNTDYHKASSFQQLW